MNLRSGYTTGTCAAAAAKAAAMVLCGQTSPHTIQIVLPNSQLVSLPVIASGMNQDGAFAAVVKDSGDDPDVTNRAVIYAYLAKNHSSEIRYFAGEGIGIVTRPGLSLSVGEPAINPTPRRMIADAIREVCACGVDITISIPGGKELAQKTFNPKLGIIGGLSIIGTSGIVKPFSAPAVTASLQCALNVAAATPIHSPVLVPGNIGERAALQLLRVNPDAIIQVSNHWGMMLQQAATLTTFKNILILGHPGKLAKLINGEWDTHSSQSQSAVGIVSHMATMNHLRIDSQPTTVDGIFTSLSTNDATLLANHLAMAITRCVETYTQSKQRYSVCLINLQGKLLGKFGNLSPWN